MMLKTMRSLAALGATSTLLKTSVRGGLLRLTSSELSYGEGLLGSRNLRRFPVVGLVALDLEDEDAAGRGVRLRLRAADGESLTVGGVSPLAARRLRELVAILRNERA
jgi:hypothetical protein